MLLQGFEPVSRSHVFEINCFGAGPISNKIVNAHDAAMVEPELFLILSTWRPCNVFAAMGQTLNLFIGFVAASE